MSLPLTPKQIVEELDRYIVGQDQAKRAVAVAVRNRWRRQQLPAEISRDVYPKNIMMIGPTGVGKTEIARRLAKLVDAPFVKVEATKFTEVGYHGRDVDAMIRDLLDNAITLERSLQTDRVKEKAERAVEERLIDQLLPKISRSVEDDAENQARAERSRERMREQLKSGELEERQIEIHVERKANIVGIMGPQSFEMDAEMQGMFEKMIPTRRETRKTTIANARKIFFDEEADKLLDQDALIRSATERCEQNGIVFIDEIDKIATSGKEHGPDVSRQGVQRDLLPIVEGGTVSTRHGPVKTDHILFIAAGAFHVSKPSDLMPELQGRFPIRVELTELKQEDLVRILREPKNSLISQQIALLQSEKFDLKFTDDAIDEMARVAFEVNRRDQDIGARRLHTIIERVLDEVSFDASDRKKRSLTIDAKYVSSRLSDLMKDEDLSKYVL